LKIAALILSFTLAFLASNCLADEATLTDKDFDLITLSSDKPAEFGRVFLSGIPWVNYTRGLLRLPTEKITAITKGKPIKKARLVLNLGVIDNAPGHPLHIFEINKPWNDGLTWMTTDGIEPWMAGKYEDNIDKATQDINLPMAEITLPSEPGEKTEEIDITSLLQEWAGGSVDNHGLLFKMGPTIHGKPDQGRWEVDIFEAKIILEFSR